MQKSLLNGGFFISLSMSLLEPTVNILLNSLSGKHLNIVAAEAIFNSYDEIIDKLLFQWGEEQVYSPDGEKEYVMPLYQEGTWGKNGYANDPSMRPRDTTRLGYSNTKQEGDRYNFEWSGEFVDNLRIKVDASTDKFYFLSLPGKTELIRSLSRMRGNKFMSLTPENNEWINEEIIIPALYEELLKTLDKAF